MPDALDAAIALHRAGRMAEAEAAYRTCLHDGIDAASRPLAVLLLQEGRFEAAAALLQPLANQFPDDAELAVNLSLALRRSERLDDALVHARRATTLAPDRIAGWNALGLAALAAGHADEALAAIDRGLRLVPGHPALLLHRAQGLRKAGRRREALTAFLACTQAAPQSLDAWRGLADVQSALGDPGAALESRARAVQLAPQDAEVAFEQAITLLQAGRARAAAQQLEAQVTRDPGNAQAWAWLGRAQLKLGDSAAARAAFAQAHALAPQDPVIAHFRAASAGTLPADVERDYIRRLFDDFADRFEHTLVDRLAYATPTHLARFLRAHAADAGQSVLDLGCGTGLMGVELARAGRRIDGVDLSPRMLEHARAKGVYVDLHPAECLEFLRAATQCWDCIVAADVFVYVADLAPMFTAAASRLAPAGCFAFSIERSLGDDTELPAETGRYRHAPARVQAQLEAAGFTSVLQAQVVLRQESDTPVDGLLFLARRH